MLSTPQNDKSVLVTTLRQSITIPITLYKTENGKIAETTALVDSGATICCINLHFVRRMKWPLQKLRRPIEAQNADGTSNKVLQYYGTSYPFSWSRDTNHVTLMHKLTPIPLE